VIPVRRQLPVPFSKIKGRDKEGGGDGTSRQGNQDEGRGSSNWINLRHQGSSLTSLFETFRNRVFLKSGELAGTHRESRGGIGGGENARSRTGLAFFFLHGLCVPGGQGGRISFGKSRGLNRFLDKTVKFAIGSVSEALGKS